MKGIWVKILGFEKYKGRADVAHNSWFRCSNRLLEDPDFFDFTAEEKLVWIYLLSIASQKNTSDIHVSHQHAHHVCRLSEKAVTTAIEKLCEIKVIKRLRARTLRGRYVGDTRTCATDITDRQDKTKHNTTREFDFELVYKKYPRKEGKSEGIKKLTREIKTLEDFENFSKAVDRYRDHVIKAGTEPKFIKHFSSFVSIWRDWLDPDTGQVNGVPGSKFGGRIEDILAEGAS